MNGPERYRPAPEAAMTFLNWDDAVASWSRGCRAEAVQATGAPFVALPAEEPLLDDRACQGDLFSGSSELLASTLLARGVDCKRAVVARRVMEVLPGLAEVLAQYRAVEVVFWSAQQRPRARTFTDGLLAARFVAALGLAGFGVAQRGA